jgi:AcrR family transcriptional regulator
MILEAAARVFDRRGYAASMVEILSEAEVTKGALYFHFLNKEALAMAVMDEQRRFIPAVAAGISPLQSIIDMTHAVARDLQDDAVLRAAVRLVIEHGSFTTPNPSAYLMWIQALRGRLQIAAAQGELLPGTDPDALSETLVGALTGIQLMDQVLNGRQYLNRKITKLWRLLLPGVVPADQICRYDPEGTGAVRRPS